MKLVFYSKLNKENKKKLLKRKAIDLRKTTQVCKKIISDVHSRGDEALRYYSKKFDSINLEKFKISNAEVEKAYSELDLEIKKSIKFAYKNIYKFHFAQKFNKLNVQTRPGVYCSIEVRPFDRVGIYIPGGSAPLVSTALMLGIPAQISGCSEIIAVSPPNKYGKLSAEVIYALSLCGIKNIYKIGGAQAIAALAFGTEEVPKVDKIFGPGNQFVTTAKMLVANFINGPAIDLPAGPTEVLIIADKFANPRFIAADLLAQAEHNTDSQCVFVSNNYSLVLKVKEELKAQIKSLPRKDIIKKVLKNSFILIVKDLKEAIKYSNEYAPEHLVLNIQNYKRLTKYISSAGSVFLGRYSAEASGDYASGTNHTLPTYGYARSYSGVNLSSYYRFITFQRITEEGNRLLMPYVGSIARAEGLEAHARSLEIRSLK